jgi:hypothetical protein
MGANSTQGQAILIFLLAFVFLSWSLCTGNLLFTVVFVVGLAASVALFLKAKPLEHAD